MLIILDERSMKKDCMVNPTKTSIQRRVMRMKVYNYLKQIYCNWKNSEVKEIAVWYFNKKDVNNITPVLKADVNNITPIH